MRYCTLALFACFLGFLARQSAQAQFYAPETEFHDKAQRLFPVEAARLLAWQENQKDIRIHEVTYEVSVSTNRLTSWQLNWLDKQGKPLKQFKVAYPESLLREGPRFYREVFEQLRTQAGLSLSRKLTAKELTAQFWAGAELNGAAREDGLRVALQLVSTNRTSDDLQLAPRMAGLLVHVTLPSLCGGMTLDSVLLARGACWLALSEALLAPSEKADSQLWASVLFLAGREPDACNLWRASVPSAVDAKTAPTLCAWWDCFLRRPSAREAFIFATSSRQRHFGMPMMTYYSRLEQLGTSLVEVLYRLYAADEEGLAALHNYGTFLSDATDVGGGRLLEGAWPAIARKEWSQVFREFVPSLLDYTNYQAKLGALEPQEPSAEPDQDDASLTGLEAYTPLLQLGYQEGVGKLIPAGVITARDWLNYGWEMNGLQMGARWWFVASLWGIPDRADAIYRRATRVLEGQAPFFKNDDQESVFNVQQTINRLQFVDDVAWRVLANVQPFSKDLTNAPAARMFHRRCWLRPNLLRWEAWSLFKAKLKDEVLPMLQRYSKEGGFKADIFILEYMRGWSDEDYKTIAGAREFRTEAARNMIDPTALQLQVLNEEPLMDKFSEQRAQRLEALFWRNPECGLEQQILNGYINGGAWKSVKRFYTQVRRVVSRDVGFSNFMAPKAWMLGFLTEDDDLMRLALKDSNSGSATAMWTLIWHHAAQGEMDRVAARLAAMIERYETDDGPRSPGRLVQGFLPLLPALKDPKAPEHEAALDYFGKSNTGIVLRWILIQRYKLPTEEAIRFLGGRETDRVRRVLVLSLLKDSEHMFEAIVDFQKESGNSLAARVLAQWQARQTLPVTLKIEEKDLRPEGAQSLVQAVEAALAQQEAEPK